MSTLGQMLRDAKLLGYTPYVGANKAAAAGEANYNHATQVVQFDDDANDVASAEASLIFTGPPVWKKKPQGKATFAELLYPVGAVQGFNVSGQPQIIPFSEVGSRNKRVGFGTAMYSANMARVLTRHSNLKYSFYQWLPAVISGKAQMLMRPGNKAGRGQFHWTNLDSDVFRIPFGILEIKITSNGDVISSRYLEKCYVSGDGDALNAGQTIIVENAGIFVTKTVPADDELVISSAANRFEEFGFADIFTFDESGAIAPAQA